MRDFENGQIKVFKPTSLTASRYQQALQASRQRRAKRQAHEEEERLQAPFRLLARFSEKVGRIAAVRLSARKA